MEVKATKKGKVADVAIAGVWMLELVVAASVTTAISACVHSWWFTATIVDVGGGGGVKTSKKEKIAVVAIGGGVGIGAGCCCYCWLPRLPHLPLLPLRLLFLLASARASTPLLLLRCVELS